MKHKLSATILVVIFLLSALSVFAVDALVSPPDSHADNSYGEQTQDFELQTIAVCLHKEDIVYCHDELFVTCGDERYMLPKAASQISCKGVTTEAPLITAFAVFDKGWKDPRIN